MLRPYEGRTPSALSVPWESPLSADSDVKVKASGRSASSLESGVPFVYMLRCKDGSLYTGIARDLEKRLAQHHAGRASRYTRSRLPVVLAWSCEVETWSDALREEIRIKGLPKAGKEALAGRPAQ
jgi:putative endonuclease